MAIRQDGARVWEGREYLGIPRKWSNICERDRSDIAWDLGGPEKPVDQKNILKVMDATKGGALDQP